MNERGVNSHRKARRALLILGWAVALVGAALLSEAVDSVVVASARDLLDADWAWPLAAAVAVTLVTRARVRDRLPDRSRRFLLGLTIFAVLYGLTAAVGPVVALLSLGLVSLGALLVAWVLLLPRRLAPPLPADTLARLSERDRLELADARLKLQNDVRATALQAIAGLAVLIGAVLAFQQLTDDRQQATATRELALQGQASERFTRAIDQLASDRLEDQLGGIYGLEQVAQQAPNNRLAVTEVLVAYLHRRSPRTDPTTQPVEELRGRAPEAQAALKVLLRRHTAFRDPRLDLSDLNLSGADISGDLFQAGSDVSYRAGDLRGADLRGTDLREATFEGLWLEGADFRGADLRGANLAGVEVWASLPDPSPRGSPPGPDDGSGIEEAEFADALADPLTSWPYPVGLTNSTGARWGSGCLRATPDVPRRQLPQIR